MRFSCKRIGQKFALEKFVGARSLFVINLEGHVQECHGFVARVFGSGRPGFLFADSVDCLQLTAGGEGMRAGEHLDNKTSQTPNVGLLGVDCLLNHFRGHPVNATLHGDSVCVATSTTSPRTKKSRGLYPFRDTEIGDLDAALVVNKDVGALDITMDDITAVEIRETGKDLPHEVLDQRLNS